MFQTILEKGMAAEMETLIEEVNKHPKIMNAPFTERMDEDLWRHLREYEAEQKGKK